MISIIICSVNNVLLEQIKVNIRETVGVPFEIVAIDNNIKKKSIAAVYNEGVGIAKFDCLCFVHEDVFIHTKNWGKHLVELLSDKRIGLVGVSGAVYKSRFGGTWSTCDGSLYRTHSIQHFKNSLEPKITNINPASADWTEVAVIDGVFMATTKEVFAKCWFDDHLLKGFHGYDIDYALQVRSKYKVVVSYQILLEHFSSGHLNRQWLQASILLHNKWKRALPAYSEAIDENSAALSDYLACSQVLLIAIKYNHSKTMVMAHYFKIISTYYRFNRLKHTKTVFRYLLWPGVDANEN